MLKRSLQIMDDLTVGIAVFNADEKIIYANKKAAQITGYSLDELNNLEEWFQRVYPDKLSRAEAKKLFQNNSNEKVYKRRSKIKRKDGSLRYLDFTISNFEEGKTLVNFTDVTDKIRNKENLKIQRSQFQQLFSNALVGILFLDNNFHIKKANKKFQEMFDFEEEEIIDRNIFGLLHTDSDKVEYNDFVKSLMIKGKLKDNVKIETKNGEWREYSLYIFKSKLPDGKTAFYATYNDVSNRKNRENEIKKVKERLELAVEGAKLSIWDWDRESGNINYNVKANDVLEYQSETGTHTIKSWMELIHPEDKREVREKIESIFAGETNYFDSEHRMRASDQSWKWVRDLGRVVARGEDGYPDRVVGILFDIHENKSKEERIEYLSFHDELTGIYNRRYLKSEIKRLNNSRQYPISIIIGDLDNLKTVNDLHGHHTGDEYIKKSAEIFIEILRTEDIIARLGGDEFAVLLPNTDYIDALDISQRIKEKYDEINRRGNLPEEFSISLGIYTVNNSEEDINLALNLADKNMYKNKGRK